MTNLVDLELIEHGPRLPAEFYQRDTKTVARELLGKRLVHCPQNGLRLSGLIVETEAYLGARDPACHTFNYRRTPRNEVMYLQGGHAYVYFIYGIHFCFNVVTRTADEPEAVLIRALQPLEGIDEMFRRRGVKNEIQLTNGPGKLCQALGIGRDHNGLALTASKLFIEDTNWSPKPRQIASSPRIGIDYSGRAVSWPLRFTVSKNKFLSKP